MTETPRFRKPAVAAGCAIALSAVLAACGSSASSTTSTPPANQDTAVTGSATTPGAGATSTSATGTNTTGSTSGSTATSASGSAAAPSTTSLPGFTATVTATSTAKRAPAPVTAEFLPQNSLPDGSVYHWTAPQIWEVNVEHPLPTVCGNALGTQVTHGVWEGDYNSGNSPYTATEDVYAFASAGYAAQQMKLSTPKCGGVTAQTANSFAWRANSAQGVTHTLFVQQGATIATLTLVVSNHDYNSALDATLLQAMTQRLSGS